MGCGSSGMECIHTPMVSRMRLAFPCGATEIDVPDILGSPVRMVIQVEGAEEEMNVWLGSGKSQKSWIRNDDVNEGGIGLGNSTNPTTFRHASAKSLKLKGCLKATQFGHTAYQLEFGIMDTRTHQFQADAKASLSFNAKTGFTKKAMTTIKALVSKGQGACKWRLRLPLLDLVGEVANKVPPKNFCWVRGVTLGAFVEGEMDVDMEDDGEEGLEGDIDVVIDAEQAKIAAAAKYADLTPPMMMSGNVEQTGGTPASWTSFNNGPLLKLLAFLDQTWVPSTRLNPQTWKPIGIDVKESKSDHAESLDKGKDRAHCVVFGTIGAGKSTFLSALAGFHLDGTGRHAFAHKNPVKTLIRRLSQRGADDDEEPEKAAGEFASGENARSVTQDIESKRFLVDRFEQQFPYTLTDVPGFDDPSRENKKTASDLMEHLLSPELQIVHALVLVNSSQEDRVPASLLQALMLLEDNFGDAMWDSTILVLSKISPPNDLHQGFNPADDWLKKKLVEKSEKFVDGVCSGMAKEGRPGANRRWRNNKKQVYLIDSDILKTQQDHFQQKKGGTVKKDAKGRPVWEDSMQAAVYKFSMDQMHRMRENISLRVKQDWYITAGQTNQDIHAVGGTYAKQDRAQNAV